jgi:hypothetical protein
VHPRPQWEKGTDVSENESFCGPAGRRHPIVRVLFSPPTVVGPQRESGDGRSALYSSKSRTAESSERETLAVPPACSSTVTRGKDNPHRQGLDSAISDGASPLKVRGGIPTVATDYSPIWDLNPAVWTQKSIERGYRSRMTGEFAILGMVQRGWITRLDGKKFGSVGVVVNCSIVYRFL